MSGVVAAMGAQADDTLDMFVKAQIEGQLNFKDMTETLLMKRDDPFTDFFLATMTATAIIRLAAMETQSRGRDDSR